MSLSPLLRDEICRLLWAFHDGSISEDDAARLRSLVIENRDARNMFVRYSFICGGIEWDYSARRDELKQSADEASPLEGDLLGAPLDFGEPGDVGDSEMLRQYDGMSFDSAAVPLGGSTAVAPRVSQWLGHVSHAGPFAYLISTVLIGLAAFGAWAWRFADCHGFHVSLSSAVATESAEPFNQAATPCNIRKVKAQEIACITGMTACRWAAGETTPSHLDYLAVGRRLHLDSGLLEITYNTGVRVVLQGPAEYEICPNGGLLEAGKLVVALKSGTHDGQQATDAAATAPVASPAQPAAPFVFAIRTPEVGAVVEKQAEFGVKADRGKATFVQVFRGSTAVCPMDYELEHPYRILNSGESLQISWDAQHRPQLSSITMEPGEFVRRLPGPDR